MFKRVQVCLCDLCQQPIDTTITRVLMTELNQNELPVANSEYDGRPVDICHHCMRSIREYVQLNLIPGQEYDPNYQDTNYDNNMNY